MTLNVLISVFEVPATFRGKLVNTPWPCLLFSSWAETIFSKTEGQPLLNGHTLANEAAWRGDLRRFWKQYREGFSHPVFRDKAASLETCIPCCLHGDEGRGKHRRAVMVTSIQPLLQGTGHSFTSRYLFTVVPSESYADDATFDMLQMEQIADLQRLYDEGIEDARLQNKCAIELRLPAMQCSRSRCLMARRVDFSLCCVG